MHSILGAAEAMGESLVALLGDPAYYHRFGFVPARSMGVIAPDPSWGDFFQARGLHVTVPTGHFRYADPFDAL